MKATRLRKQRYEAGKANSFEPRRWVSNYAPH